MPRSVPFKARRLRPLLLLLLVGNLRAGGASEITLQREGDGWTPVIRGSISPAKSEIRLTACGDITVRGSRNPLVTYTLTEHFRDRDLGSSGEKRVREAASAIAIAMRARSGSPSINFPCTRQIVRVEIPKATSRVTVNSTEGNIDVAGVDGAVFTRNGAGRTTLDQIGGDAEVRTAGGCTTLGLIGGNLHCVSGGGAIRARTIRGEAVFETSGGEIYAAEALGAVRAYTGAGSIRIGHAGSSVMAATQGGPIEIGRAAGVVIANNSGGPIHVSSAPGVRCETASGAIRLTGISGSIIASTTLGDIIASLFGAHLVSNSLLQTGGGDITVLIPSNISVTLKATTMGGSGMIVSDFPVRLSCRGPMRIAEGRINGGGPLLQIAGQGGTISIKRQ